jgi:hypothetical protein
LKQEIENFSGLSTSQLNHIYRGRLLANNVDNETITSFGMSKNSLVSFGMRFPAGFIK